MKIIELNIGLSSKTQGTLNPNEVLNALTGRGFTLLKYRLQDSVSQDGKETCLAVKAECPNDWQSQLASLSDKLGQDCIAIVGFIGHSPYDTFCAPLWVSPEEEDAFDSLAGLHAVQAKQAAEEIHNGFTRQEFENYLEFSVIPDSRESGFDGYAEDLETALHFLRSK